MKEIKIHSKIDSSFGNIIKKVEVNENTVNFEQGIALVDGLVTQENCYGEIYYYKRQGVITKNYEELSCTLDSRENMLQFFTGGEHNIFRYSPQDFIVKENFDNPNASYGQFYHIRVINNVPVLINTFGGTLEPTENPNIVCVNNEYFYDIVNANYVSIEESSKKQRSLFQ